ncbi:hypothetical protein [Pseudoxanthomonas mexicana]
MLAFMAQGQPITRCLSISEYGHFHGFRHRLTAGFQRLELPLRLGRRRAPRVAQQLERAEPAVPFDYGVLALLGRVSNDSQTLKRTSPVRRDACRQIRNALSEPRGAQ